MPPEDERDAVRGLTPSEVSLGSHACKPWTAAAPCAGWHPGSTTSATARQTTLYRLVQQHAATFFPQAEAATGAGLPQFVKDEFDAFPECGILVHSFLRVRRGDCGHDKLVAGALGEEQGSTYMTNNDGD